MGAKGAVEIIFRGQDVDANTSAYQERFANPMVAAERPHRSPGWIPGASLRNAPRCRRADVRWVSSQTVAVMFGYLPP